MTELPASQMETNTASPTDDGGRIAALDVIRGIAVLGILLMNILVMGRPYELFMNPSLLGPVSDMTGTLWLAVFTGFEGVYRTLFGMLFGAGVYLFMSRLEERFNDKVALGLHLKRSGWLIAFGMIDAYLLLWVGDILVLYGMIGLFLWLFRRVSNKVLAIWIIVFLSISVFLKLGEAFSIDVSLNQLAAFEQRVEAGETLSQTELALQKDLQEALAFNMPKPEDLQSQIDTIKTGYAGTATIYYPTIVLLQTIFALVFSLWDSLISMLIGIFLFRVGFITGKAKTGTYLFWLVAGMGSALSIRYIGYSGVVESGWDLATMMKTRPYYDFTRVGMALGMISLICMALRFGALPLSSAFAATGRMALSNYIGQSIFALVFFILGGQYFNFGFGALLALTLPVWAVQMAFSLYWMKTHQQGPLEAVWRRLTYGKENTAST